MIFPSGAAVGQYVVGRELGRGAMATVYEARHVVLRKDVALKAMHAHLAVDEGASARFLREGRAAAQVRSPHVVDVFDVGQHEGIPYLVMELLRGVDLATLLVKRGKLPLGELADIMLPIASAVFSAHTNGVVHRDLKPSNVFLAEREGAVWPTVLDFGISKVSTDIDRDLTGSTVLLGTVHYLSPEQTRSARNGGPLTDQYALGVMLYECATGRRPFAGSTPYSVMHAIVSAKVAPPSTLDPSLPASFDDVVLRAMHRDPAKRFASVCELGASLLVWAGAESQKKWAPVFGAPPPLTGESPRPRRRIMATAIAAGFVLAATSLGAASRGAHPDAPPAPAALAVEPPAQHGELQPTPQPPDRAPHDLPPPGQPAPAPETLDVPAEGVHRVEPPRPAPTGAPSTAPTDRGPPAPHGQRPAGAPAGTASSRVSSERGTNGALILE
jgi:serine/threonine-protein kinase